MEALLGSQQQRGNHVCGSVNDLQAQLHNFLLSKSSETRAEHVSLTFELRYNTVFHLPPESSSENNGRSQSADPTQSQSQSQPPAIQQQQQQQQEPTRSVTASEIIHDQPSDDPVLQKAVARHIMGRIALVDNSTWNVRQIARAAQGWTFTYICKDSHQAWTRAHAKNSERPVIGAFSGYGGLDPVNSSRPAFDCRGTLSIAFSKTHRGVVVKYDHTLLHKTVGQLVELLAPTPVPVPVVAGSTRTPKAKRPPPAEGEEGSRKKRPRKKKSLAPEAPMEGGAAPDSQQPTQSTANTEAPQASAPEASQPGTADAAGFLNVPPLEAARRKETAISLLTGKGIDPATLSAEQFNIFANQAPQLQEASLEMLAKYGAEKLRIVHPDDQAGSTTSTPSQAPFTAATPTTANVAPSTAVQTPTKARRGKRKSNAANGEVSIGDGAVVSVDNGAIGTTASTLIPPQAKARRTRGACEICKQKKLKCTKEHPACSICQGSGEQCVYAPPKPRRKSEKTSVVEVAEAEDSDAPDDTQRPQPQPQSSMPVQQLVEVHEPTPPPPPPQPPAPMHTQPPAPMEDLDNDEFIPDPNILSAPVEQHHPPPTATQQAADNYYQSHNEATFPHQTNPERSLVSGLTFPPSQNHETTSHPTNGLTFPPTPAAPVSQHNRGHSTVSNRHSLPTAQTKQSPVPAPAIPMQTNTWNNSPAPKPPVSTVSPTMAQQAAKRQRPPRRSVPDGAPKIQDGMQQQATSISQAALQAQNQRSPAMTVRSPYQAAATVRTASRQSHRSQSNTPVSTTSLSQPPQQAHQPVSTSYSSNQTSVSSSIPNYEPYARYNTSTDHSSRIAYEPGAYQTQPAVTTSASYSATPSYDYTRNTAPVATTTSNPLNQALNTSSGAYGATTGVSSSQWQTSQTRSTQPQPSHYSSHGHGYNNSPEQQRATTASSYAPNQQQQQAASTTQPSQQGWYGFGGGANAHNNSSRNAAGYGGASTTAASTATPYQSHRPNNVPGYASHGYPSSDEQSIYDLLRASSSGH